MPNPLYMLEYLEYAGVDIKPLIDEKAIKKEVTIQHPAKAYCCNFEPL